MPAILYIGFTLTHITIDLFNKLYNTAILKFVLMIIFTTMLDLLCKSGLTDTIVDYCIYAFYFTNSNNCITAIYTRSFARLWIFKI